MSMRNLALSITLTSALAAGSVAVVSAPVFAQESCPSYQLQPPTTDNGNLKPFWDLPAWSEFAWDWFWTPVPVC